MLDGRPRRRVGGVRLVYLTVIKGVGELRYNTFTSTRSNACFLVGIISILHPISVVSTPFRLILAQNTNIFIFLHQNQVKFNQITPK